jgi:hypothetical protein
MQFTRCNLRDRGRRACNCLKPRGPARGVAVPWRWSLAALETLIAKDRLDQHDAMLSGFSAVELWRPPPAAVQWQ